jgi:hypothetical protein
MSRRVAVTDHAFQNVGREAETARRFDASFAEYASSTAAETRDAVAGPNVVFVNFAPMTADILRAPASAPSSSAAAQTPTRCARVRVGAVLVNTSRGGRVDPEALADALESGHRSRPTTVALPVDLEGAQVWPRCLVAGPTTVFALAASIVALVRALLPLVARRTTALPENRRGVIGLIPPRRPPLCGARPRRRVGHAIR